MFRMALIFVSKQDVSLCNFLFCRVLRSSSALPSVACTFAGRFYLVLKGNGEGDNAVVEGDVYLAVVGFGYGLGYVETETVAACAAVAG